MIEDALASEGSETEIEIELLCGCDCGQQDNTHCEHGVNNCGLCDCETGYSGPCSRSVLCIKLFINIDLPSCMEIVISSVSFKGR